MFEAVRCVDTGLELESVSHEKTTDTSDKLPDRLLPPLLEKLVLRLR